LLLSTHFIKEFAMNIANRHDLLSALEITRKHLCVYGAGTPCDCKFGVTHQETLGKSEVGSGCPEVASAIALVEAMTPRQFEELVKKHEQQYSMQVCPFCQTRTDLDLHVQDEDYDDDEDDEEDEEEDDNDRRSTYRVRCESCDVSGPKGQGKAEAIQKWNDRAAGTGRLLSLADTLLTRFGDAVRPIDDDLPKKKKGKPTKSRSMVRPLSRKQSGAKLKPSRRS
jgi:hypothetical protein